MGSLKSIGVIALSYLIYVALTDIAGALLVTVLPGPDSVTFSGHSGYGSVALYYVVWFVAGCFAGAFFTAYNFKDKKKADEPVQENRLLIFMIALVMSAGLILFFYSVGEMNEVDWDYSSNYYVPGNRSLTYTFFGSFLAVMVLVLGSGRKGEVEKKGGGKEDHRGRT